MKSGGGSADGVLDAVKNVNDTVNFLNGVGDARSGIGKELRVLREKLNDDGLGLAGKVADHVLQDLDEFDLGGGLGLLDLRPNVGDNLVDVALPIALELDGEVAAIGFRDRREA